MNLPSLLSLQQFRSSIILRIILAAIHYIKKISERASMISYRSCRGSDLWFIHWAFRCNISVMYNPFSFKKYQRKNIFVLYSSMLTNHRIMYWPVNISTTAKLNNKMLWAFLSMTGFLKSITQNKRLKVNEVAAIRLNAIWSPTCEFSESFSTVGVEEVMFSISRKL